MNVISEFYINDLYKERNVRIPFETSYKIIVAENGFGKTTILNAFYALLSGDTSKLRKINFSTIGVVFSDGDEISFNKSDFDASLEFIKEHSIFEHIVSKLGQDFILGLIDDVKKNRMVNVEESAMFRHARVTSGIPGSMLHNFMKEAIRNSTSNSITSQTQDKLDNIKKKFPLKTLYLPTYRRVEEDIRAFSSVSEDESNRHALINFGMGDVQRCIDEITSEIKNSSVEWFSKINGQILSQLVNGFEVSDEMRKSISSSKAVEIVLERIGENISESHKEQILNLVNSGEIQKEHDPLVYFVANLLKVFEQQQENDSAIQLFTSVSNKYLRDKKIVYNESNVTIEIIRKKNKKIVDIESLSSGEKQIISLFALLYLQKKNDLAIFFDEPELSLSIEWQKTLLPDITNSGRCKFLFSTTHSPFIFENELQDNTVDLAEYVEEL